MGGGIIMDLLSTSTENFMWMLIIWHLKTNNSADIAVMLSSQHIISGANLHLPAHSTAHRQQNFRHMMSYNIFIVYFLSIIYLTLSDVPSHFPFCPSVLAVSPRRKQNKISSKRNNNEARNSSEVWSWYCYPIKAGWIEEGRCGECDAF